MQPRIFISAVTAELGTTRQLAANVLTRLGYTPVWQDIFGTESGDLRQMLRDQIDACDGLVHLVGSAYGAEPPEPDAEIGRVSYTQYELLYAQQQKKRTWIIFAAEGYPSDRPLEQLDLPSTADHADPLSYQAERRDLQAKWRERCRAGSHVWHPATTRSEIELLIERLRKELPDLRAWQRTVLVGLAALLLVGLGIWFTVFRQHDTIRAVVEETSQKQTERIAQALAALRPADHYCPAISRTVSTG